VLLELLESQVPQLAPQYILISRCLWAMPLIPACWRFEQAQDEASEHAPAI
jgi:hypothetical protein